MLRRAGIALSVALNLLVIAAVAWLLLGGGTRFVIARFLAPAHAQRVSHFDAFAIEPGDVVFLGDSITEGGRWEEIFPGARARNRGIGGDTTAGVLARLPQVSERRPAQVFLLIGTNDLFAGVPEAQIAENVAAIITRLRAGSPESRLFVQSVLPRGAEYRARRVAERAAPRDRSGRRRDVRGPLLALSRCARRLDPRRTLERRTAPDGSGLSRLARADRRLRAAERRPQIACSTSMMCPSRSFAKATRSFISASVRGSS